MKLISNVEGERRKPKPINVVETFEREMSIFLVDSLHVRTQWRYNFEYVLNILPRDDFTFNDFFSTIRLLASRNQSNFVLQKDFVQFLFDTHLNKNHSGVADAEIKFLVIVFFLFFASLIFSCLINTRTDAFSILDSDNNLNIVKLDVRFQN